MEPHSSRHRWTVETLPAEVRADLAPSEEVRHVAVGRLLGSPDAAEGLGGLAVLTSDRILLLPDPPETGRDRASRSPLVAAFFEVWSAFGGPIPGPTRKRAGFVTRARPGVDLPLSEARDVFVSRVPRAIGLTLSLPAPDPRPPWALFLELPDASTARAWAETASRLRGVATPKPDLYRPYSLYYLTRPQPRPVVLVHGPLGARRGGLRLGPDGPQVGGHERETVLPYESIDRLEWAEPTTWRGARLRLDAAERSYRVEPASGRDAGALLELTRVLAEMTGLPLERASGPVRAGRIAFWAAATASGVGAAIWELLIHH
jgi:hypothetical protein